MSSPIRRNVGYKEFCFNIASRIVGRNAKQCCYACAGLSEKPLYFNDKKHGYLFVAIYEGHVSCLEKIIDNVTKKIYENNNITIFKSEKIKIRYLRKIYMSIIEMNIDDKKMERMIQVLKKYGLSIEDDADAEDTYRL